MTWAIEKPCKSAAQKLVLLMLANHTNGHTGQCNPSHAKLAEECCMSLSSLKTQIKSLEELGYLRVIRKVKDGVYLPNQYELLLADCQAQGESNSEGVGQILTGVGQILTGGRSNSGYKPVIKPVIETVVVVSERENFKNFELTQEQQDCKEWASTQNYWASCTQSDEEFLKVWAKPSGALRKQFNAHKKAAHLGGATRLNAENQNFGKSTEGNYATHYTNHKKPTAADIAKSLRERANAADYANVPASELRAANGQFATDANAEILVRYD